MPLDEKKLARYNLGRQFYQDHLSAISLYDTLPKADEYSGFTDAAVIGFLDMLSDDIRTIQERTAKTVHFTGRGYAAYGPGSITDAATYESISHELRLNHDPQYAEGWNAAIDHILKLSEKWMYHTGSEEPPYHLPCIDDEKRRELLMLKRE